MPVPRHGLEREVMFGREMAFQAAEPDHQQHGGSQRHVQAMKAGQHEKGGAVNSRVQTEVQILVGVNVLLRLEAEKNKAQ